MSNITIYEAIANAIILQAVKDYRMALKSLKANSRNRTAQADKAEIEQFLDVYKRQAHPMPGMWKPTWRTPGDTAASP